MKDWTNNIIKLETKTEKEDKRGYKYLILKTNIGDIYVFSTIIPENSWEQLKEGSNYYFTIKISQQQTQVLQEFNRIITVIG